MNSPLNRCLRCLLALFFHVAGTLLTWFSTWERKRAIPRDWKRIQDDLLQDDPPPRDYEGQRENLLLYQKNSQEELFMAQTSGTRGEPKLIPYTKSRLRKSQQLFLKSMIILTSPFKGTKTFFVLASVDEEKSLTAGLLNQGRPGRMELLQAPYRFLNTQEGRELRSEIGLHATRLALMIFSSPRFLYATNPSTLTHFLEETTRDWDSLRENLQRLMKSEHFLKMLDVLAEGDARDRLQKIASHASPPTLPDITPYLKAVITWDGGYVSPYTEKLKSLMPPHVVHLPMYSMSTETIETLPMRREGRLHFLPVMPATYPEFLQEGELHGPQDVKVGETYSLVITNSYGFIRYDTKDEFTVMDLVDGLPDLRFKRRRDVTASMTGEKISEAQCLMLFQELKRLYPLGEHFLTLFGNTRDGAIRYQLGLIGPLKEMDLLEIAQRAQVLLGQINEEYRTKVDSGRLHPLSAHSFTLPEFAQLMGKEDQWESQFKVMPLYEKPLL